MNAARVTIAKAIRNARNASAGRFRNSLDRRKTNGNRAGSRASERWSIAKLGEYACVRDIFKNLKTLNPSPTAVYDASNFIRSKGWWGKDSGCALAGKGLGDKLDVKSKTAPTAAVLSAAIKAGTGERNRDKVQTFSTPKEEIAKMRKRLEKLNNDGIEKTAKRKAQAALHNVHLTEAIAALTAFEGGEKVAKRRITAKAAKRKAA